MDDSPPPRVVSAPELFGDGDRIVIRHGESDYELRITRRKRLILTKCGATGDVPPPAGEPGLS
jgi:hemin uptake protein HemP